MRHPDAFFLTQDSGLDGNVVTMDAGYPPPVEDTCQSPGSTIGRACVTVGECQDGCFCNGVESCEAGHCVAGPLPCTDTVDCTTDACAEEANRCVHVPNHASCSDGMACNGYELCDATMGCVSVAPLVCNDESSCTLDSCDDAIGCVFTARDLDHDGFISGACGGTDCDDYSAAVQPGATEICDNRRDDNCDGLRDYSDSSCRPTNDTCAEATILTLGPTGGSFSGSTTGLTSNYSLGCGGSGPDAVFRFALTEPHDVRITVSGASGTAFALRPFAQCLPGPDMRCTAQTPPVINQRSLGAGDWAIIVATPFATNFDLRIELSDPTPIPPVDVCNGATLDVSAGGTFTGRFEDTADNYALTCHSASSTDVAYRFVVPAGHQRDVLITASTMTGSASANAYLALTTDCGNSTSTITCLQPSASQLRRRTLDPGTYYILLEPADASATTWSMTVTFTDPPAPRNVGDACGTAIDITPSGPATTGMGSVSLSTLEFDTGTTCGAGGSSRDAYFHFSLASAQDVTITTTGPSHASALETGCGVRTSELRCRSGSSPVSQSFHSLPAGDYWIATETTTASGTINTSVTISPPTPPPANDQCGGAIALSVPIDSRARDTLMGFADDVPGGACAAGGLVDALYTFTLPSAMNVTLDAITLPSSTRNISLTVRGVCGAGTDVACGTGRGSAHIATTTPLAAGTYYVFVEMTEAESSDFTLRLAAFP